jgi:outer membrane protein insertion porin family
MKIYSVLIFLALFFFIRPCTDAYVISNVVVEGVHNVKLKNILSIISIKKDQTYSVDEARENVRAIAALECFENVEVRFDNHNGTLAFVVTEKPYVQNIVFKGNSKISTGRLKSVSILKEKDHYDLFKFENTKSKIYALYQDEGYSDCQVEAYHTVDVDTNRMTITFLITENSKIVVGGIKINGVVFFKNKKILKLMKTKPGKIFKENLFKSDMALIQTFYENNGFMDYHFVTYTSKYNEARTEIFLTLNINEGVRYEVGSVSYNGNLAVDDKEIRKQIKFKKGHIFSQHKVVETIHDIYAIYFDKGYLYAKISQDFNKEKSPGVVDINLTIQENSLVLLGNVYIDGTVSTKDKVIRRELILNSGDVLSIKKIRKSIEKIYNLGFIENVEYQILTTNATNILDLSFTIAESKPGRIVAGLGYSSVERIMGSIQIQHINLFGLGQKLSLLCELCAKKQNYEIDWTEPKIFDKNMSLNLNVFDVNRRRDYDNVMDEYEENRTGFAVNIGPKINDYLNLLFGYTFEHVKLSKIKGAKNNIVISSDDTLNLLKNKTSSIFMQCMYDSRDYIFDPSNGNKQLLNIQMASNLLGGNVNFVKGITRSTWHFPTIWKFVLSINMEIGAITAYGNQSRVPVYEKFYVGGASIRGYKYRSEIGPKNGGKIKGIINIEYKFPIVVEKGRSILQGAIFYDIGGAWKNFENINLKLRSDPENLHSGVGFGIRFTTPVFPIKLDWGYGLNHKEGEPLRQFYFNIGNVF